ncbi:phospholipase D family protein [Endozoicomonas numazuensis]|uniref:phospholipase D family protein n=1 Tax=Endozoicomonas numazuensis TaxID=1137799 RepID=UPI00191BF173|nr:phospholipase D family protein [Endozoicomonas numazuensis]
MAKFLNTSATNYYLEELIKTASDRLILISPFLKLNDRIKELLEDKNRLKIDVRIVYGKSELQPEEINWLKELTFVRTSFCKNLHAKCYINEESCIITSLNLYEFSQVNNNEMGMHISRSEDFEIYKDAYRCLSTKLSPPPYAASLTSGLIQASDRSGFNQTSS